MSASVAFLCLSIMYVALLAGVMLGGLLWLERQGRDYAIGALRIGTHVNALRARRIEHVRRQRELDASQAAAEEWIERLVREGEV